MTAPIARWILSLAAAALVMGLALASAARAQEAAGSWHGELVSPESGGSLRLGLEIVRAPDGTLSGVLTSPDQTDEKIPIEGVQVSGGELGFTSQAVMGRFRGTWDAARGAWAGQWMQAGQVLPLVLEKGPPPARAKP